MAANGTGEVVGRFEIKGAKARCRRSAGPRSRAPTARCCLKLAAGGKLTTLDFEGHANGLLGKGQVRFAGDNALQQVTLQQIKIGRTDVAVDWKRGPGGVELACKGRALELAARAPGAEGARRDRRQGAGGAAAAVAQHQG